MTVALPKRNTLQHMFRGMTTLEHVGSHPGIPFVVFLIAITTMSVANNGLIAMLVGLVFAVALYVPMLLIGAVGRSKTNDSIDKRQQERMLQFLEKEW